MDKRKHNGGARKGAGRKPKADEDRVRTLSIGAIKKVFGSEEEGWLHIAKQAKESFPHLKMLYEYSYGKPKETVENIVSMPKPDKKVFTDFNG